VGQGGRVGKCAEGVRQMYGVERCARASKRHRASQVIMP
jgi:hypothetical protein